MEKFFNFLGAIVNTIRHNGFFIFLAIIFPILIYQFGAGEEIIWDLTSENRKATNFFVVCSFAFLSITIWCIPAISIKLFLFLTQTDSNKYNSLLDRLLDIYNAKPTNKNSGKRPQIPVRYLSLLPWFIFILAMSNFFYNKKILIITFLTIVLFIFILDNLKISIINISHKFYTRFKLTWELQYYLLIIIIAFLFSRFISLNTKYLILVLNIIAFFLNYLFFKIKENSEGFNTPNDKKILRKKIFYTHIISLLIAHIAVVYYFVSQQYGILYRVSPIVLAIFITSFYILFIELFFSSQLLLVNIIQDDLKEERLRYKVYQFAVGACILFFLISFFYSFNPHTFRKEQVNNESYIYERENIEAYFKKWYSKRVDTTKITNDTLNIYLVSGQGGGSRAGAWLLLNLDKLDSLNNNFYQNLFSISTVSGSTSGAQMFLASKELDYKNLLNEKNDFAKNIYTKNYLTSGLYGFLIGDALESFMGNFRGNENDRNYYFQNEEMMGFQNAFLKNLKNPNDEKSKKISIKKTENFFTRDFMYNYYLHRKDLNFPLFFINSTIIENGKKAVFSPVILNSIMPYTNSKIGKARFTYYEDAYGIFRKCEWSRNKELPLVSCVNASQSFPIINAYSYLHSVGRLGDGGMYENSGTSTTEEVYLSLKRLCKKNNYKVKFVLINITNSKLDDDEAVFFKKASILNTVTELVSNPFTGHQLMAVKQLEKAVIINDDSQNDRIINIKLEKEYPLTRIMSDSTIIKMKKELDSCVSRNQKNYYLDMK